MVILLLKFIFVASSTCWTSHLSVVQQWTVEVSIGTCSWTCLPKLLLFISTMAFLILRFQTIENMRSNLTTKLFWLRSTLWIKTKTLIVLSTSTITLHACRVFTHVTCVIEQVRHSHVLTAGIGELGYSWIGSLEHCVSFSILEVLRLSKSSRSWSLCLIVLVLLCRCVPFAHHFQILIHCHTRGKRTNHIYHLLWNLLASVVWRSMTHFRRPVLCKTVREICVILRVAICFTHFLFILNFFV
jgi:hypothetical protein